MSATEILQRVCVVPSLKTLFGASASCIQNEFPRQSYSEAGFLLHALLKQSNFQGSLE